MATKENINWKRINMGDILPCQSFLRKKDGEILKLSTSGGVKVGQDCYYLPVDEVINVIKNYPIEESEDEKIRKAIYNCVKWFGFDSCFFKDVSQEECLVWIKKQREQKYTKKDVDDAYLKGVCDAKHELKKHGEQKPYGLREECKDCQCNYVGECKGSCAMKRGEQKPAWSEEDELMFVSIIKTLKLTNGAAQMKIDWLNDIKCRVGSKVNCTTARKWSGEDEELCEHLIKGIEELDPLPTSIYSDCKKWLKILKDRYSWMPSEEQVMYLSEAIDVVTKAEKFSIATALKELREQLKKLME